MSCTSQLPSLSLHQSGFTFICLSRTAPLKCSTDFQETGHNVDYAKLYDHLKGGILLCCCLSVGR